MIPSTTGPRMTRRAALARLGGLGALLSAPALLAGCGSDDPGDPAASGANSSSGSTTTAPPAGRTVTHRFGTTDVPANPTRIVATGTTDADALLALGITPIAAYPNTGFGDGAFWPWLNDRPEMKNVAKLELDASFRINVEQLAALKPDLILAVNSYLEPEADYNLFSKIAPTVSASSDPVAMSWAEHAREIAAALGREADVETALAAVDGRIADTVAANPSFKGKSLSFGGVFSPTEATMVFGEKDYSRVFLAQLGFTVPARQLAELPGLLSGQQGGEVAQQTAVGLERLDLIDGDVLVLAYLDPAVQKEFEAREVFKQVPVVATGRYIAATAGTVAALRIPSVLAVPYVLDTLVPDLRRVLG